MEVVECVARLLVVCGHGVNVSQLDEGCALIKTLSPAVDDLISELEAPVAIEACRSMVHDCIHVHLTIIVTLNF